MIGINLSIWFFSMCIISIVFEPTNMVKHAIGINFTNWTVLDVYSFGTHTFWDVILCVVVWFCEFYFSIKPISYTLAMWIKSTEIKDHVQFSHTQKNGLLLKLMTDVFDVDHFRRNSRIYDCTYIYIRFLLFS